MCFVCLGALTYDPVIGAFDYVQEQVTMYPMIVENNNLFNLNSTELAAVEKIHKDCGYEGFIEKYLTFPASGVQPPVFWNYSSSSPDVECDAFDTALGFAFNHNPCFNIYEINAVCPIPWDVLGFPTELVINTPGSPVYFERPEVKAALHAPNVTWAECGNINVFVGGGSGPESEGDLSADPIQHVLPKVIEHTNRVLVGNGDYDMIIQTNGTLLSIQNMTWNGKLGFEHQPSTPISINIPDLLYAQQFNENGYNGADGPQGEMGVQHYERGLMWAQTFMSGHMQPEFQPRVSYRHLQWLLGRVDAL
jgi:carboxypeptidase D